MPRRTVLLRTFLRVECVLEDGYGVGELVVMLEDGFDCGVEFRVQYGLESPQYFLLSHVFAYKKSAGTLVESKAPVPTLSGLEKLFLTS